MSDNSKYQYQSMLLSWCKQLKSRQKKQNPQFGQMGFDSEGLNSE